MIKTLTGKAHWLRATFVVTALLSGCGPPLGVHHARTLPLDVTHGMVIAQNQPLGRRGSLNLLCGSDGSFRLFLHARLPYPGERPASGVGSTQEGVVFVGGLEKQIRLTFTVFSGEVDESVSDRLTADEIAALQSWWGTDGPGKVSVYGLFETGVRLRGRGAARDIANFRRDCAVRAQRPVVA